MAPFLALHKIVFNDGVKTDRTFFFLAHPNTYQGLPTGDTGVTKCDGEDLLEQAIGVRQLLGAPYLLRVVVYLQKEDGKRTARSLVLPSGKIVAFARKYRDKTMQTAKGGVGKVIGIKTPTKRFNF